VTGELEGRPGGKNRLIREFRLFGTIGLVVVLVFGGIQIWQISLAPHTATVRVAPETDPTSADDSAEWLLGLLEVEVRLPERDDPLRDTVDRLSTTTAGTRRSGARANRRAFTARATPAATPISTKSAGMTATNVLSMRVAITVMKIATPVQTRTNTRPQPKPA